MFFVMMQKNRLNQLPKTIKQNSKNLQDESKTTTTEIEGNNAYFSKKTNVLADARECPKKTSKLRKKCRRTKHT